MLATKQLCRAIRSARLAQHQPETNRPAKLINIENPKFREPPGELLSEDPFFSSSIKKPRSEFIESNFRTQGKLERKFSSKGKKLGSRT